MNSKYQKLIDKSTSLEALQGALISLEAKVAAQDMQLSDVIDISALPTFGGSAPSDTADIWSWDESRFLVSNWGIIARTDATWLPEYAA